MQDSAVHPWSKEKLLDLQGCISKRQKRQRNTNLWFPRKK